MNLRRQPRHWNMTATLTLTNFHTGARSDMQSVRIVPMFFFFTTDDALSKLCSKTGMEPKTKWVVTYYVGYYSTEWPLQRRSTTKHCLQTDNADTKPLCPVTALVRMLGARRNANIRQLADSARRFSWISYCRCSFVLFAVNTGGTTGIVVVCILCTLVES